MIIRGLCLNYERRERDFIWENEGGKKELIIVADVYGPRNANMKGMLGLLLCNCPSFANPKKTLPRT